MKLRRRHTHPEMIDIYLTAANALCFRIPLEEAVEHMGVNGYHVRVMPPYKWLMTLLAAPVGALFFGYYAFIVLTGFSPQIWGWGLLGAIVGSIVGWCIGAVMQGHAFRHFYAAWTTWGPLEKTRALTPMEHVKATDLMEAPTPEHRAAFLARVGELPMRRKAGSPWQPDGQEQEEEPVVDSAATAHVVAAYSPKGLYAVMEGVIFRRILTIKRSTERLIQIASIGTIALGMMVIAALVVLVFTQDNNPTGKASTAPSAYQGESNAKK